MGGVPLVISCCQGSHHSTVCQGRFIGLNESYHSLQPSPIRHVKICSCNILCARSVTMFTWTIWIHLDVCCFCDIWHGTVIFSVVSSLVHPGFKPMFSVNLYLMAHAKCAGDRKACHLRQISLPSELNCSCQHFACVSRTCRYLEFVPAFIEAVSVEDCMQIIVGARLVKLKISRATLFESLPMYINI